MAGDINEGPIRVVGLSGVRAALRAVDHQAPVAMRLGLREIAADVAEATKAKVPHRSGRMAASYKPRATQTGAGIAFGGRAAVYAPFIEFGGSVGRGHVAGRPWSGAIKRTWMGKPVGDGRYLYPTISEKRPETLRRIDELIKHVITANGFETRKAA